MHNELLGERTGRECDTWHALAVQWLHQADLCGKLMQTHIAAEIKIQQAGRKRLVDMPVRRIEAGNLMSQSLSSCQSAMAEELMVFGVIRNVAV